MMVGPQGNTVYCNAHGFGYVGAPLAHRAFSNCVEDHKAAGFLPIEEAGTVGIQLSQSLLVSVVTLNSPAANAGVMVGDKLVRVNGQPVIDNAAAHTMLFGKVGTPISFTINRDGTDIPISVTRGSRVQEDK
jgi:S1-C subfamily serine protease